MGSIPSLVWVKGYGNSSEGCSCGLDSVPGPGTSICHECSHKNEKNNLLKNPSVIYVRVIKANGHNRQMNCLFSWPPPAPLPQPFSFFDWTILCPWRLCTISPELPWGCILLEFGQWGHLLRRLKHRRRARSGDFFPALPLLLAVVVSFHDQSSCRAALPPWHQLPGLW